MSNIITGENYNYMFPINDKDDSLKTTQKNFQLKINCVKDDGQSIEFEILNAPAIFHNTIRRLILNEVPSVSIDKIYLYYNSTVLEDTDLQLRIGLIPLEVDPDRLKFYDGELPNSDENMAVFKSDSCIFFELNTAYKKRDYIRTLQLNKNVAPFTNGATPKFIDQFNQRVDMSIYSDDLKWIPLENQREVFDDVKAVDGILLDRIMPGEEIMIRCLAVKGYGHDHAKFIPVSAAHGRMAHKIVLKDNIIGKDAEILESIFPKGVIKIKKNKAVVSNPLLMKRTNKNYNEVDSLKGKIDVSLDSNHYIWKIESVRPKCQPAHKILISGFQAMIDKCSFYLENLEILLQEMKSEEANVNAKSFAKKHHGKMCYIEIIKPKGNPKFPMFNFIGETATLGGSLSYVITEKYGEEVLAGYADIQNGIELTLEIVGRKTNVDTTEILKQSLKSLSKYFRHMKNCFEKEYEAFVSADVDME